MRLIPRKLKTPVFGGKQPTVLRISIASYWTCAQIPVGSNRILGLLDFKYSMKSNQIYIEDFPLVVTEVQLHNFGLVTTEYLDSCWTCL